jgi:hypothetical protein
VVRSSLSLSDVGADPAKWNVSENAGQKSYRGEQLSYVVVFMGKLAPDVHRELRRVHVMGNVGAGPSWLISMGSSHDLENW